MARGRFHSKERVTNYRLESLPLPCATTFDRMIDFADVEGRLKGEARLINKMVWPLRSFSNAQVDNWLNKLWGAKDSETGLGLIERYEVDGHKYLWLPGFEKHQKGLQKDREAPSEIPPPPAELMEKARAMVVRHRGKKEEKTNHQIKTDDMKVAGMIKCFEEKTGRMLSPMDLNRLVDFADRYPDGWFEKAIDEAAKNEARSPIRYIEKILENWLEKHQPVQASANNQGIAEL